jgi:hypothetical protein
MTDQVYEIVAICVVAFALFLRTLSKHQEPLRGAELVEQSNPNNNHDQYKLKHFRMRRREYDRSERMNSTPNNNHDHLKVKHRTRQDAEAEANRMRRREYDRSERMNSTPNNNHDHLKVKHSTRQDAEAEANRMRRRGYEGSERLNVYYNGNLRGWYVGRGWE